MKQKDKIKNELFEKYSSNFKMISFLEKFDILINESVYVCPLCKRCFTSDSLNPLAKNHLTIEHIPPKSVGGMGKILTCKECNNNHGSTFDSHLDKKHNKIAPFLNMSSEIEMPCTFEVGKSIKSGGYLFFDKNQTLNFVFQQKRTSPENYNNLKKYQNKKKGIIEFRFKGHNPLKSNISMLRSAFLIAFKKLGYGFLLSKNSDIPRKLIQNFQSGSTKFNAILKAEFPDDMLGLNIIVKPREINGYLVVVKIKNENYGVVLPGANQQGESIYKEVDKLISKRSKSTLDFIPIDNMDYINEEKYCLLPYYNWLRKKNNSVI